VNPSRLGRRDLVAAQASVGAPCVASARLIHVNLREVVACHVRPIALPDGRRRLRGHKHEQAPATFGTTDELR